MKKILFVVDISNLYYTVKSNFNNAKVDFVELYNWAADKGEIYRAIAYGAALGDEAGKFTRFLNHVGFEVKYKEPKVVFRDGDREVRKADWDVGMAMDIVRILPNVDEVILGTADGDLLPVFDYIQEQGKTCRVIGCGISRDIKARLPFTEIGRDLLVGKTNEANQVVQQSGPLPS